MRASNVLKAVGAVIAGLTGVFLLFTAAFAVMWEGLAAGGVPLLFGFIAIACLSAAALLTRSLVEGDRGQRAHDSSR